MSLGDGYRRLAALIDEIEGDGVVVRRAEPGDEPGGTDRSALRLTATLTVEIPLDGSASGATERGTGGRYVADPGAEEAPTSGEESTATARAPSAATAGRERPPTGLTSDSALVAGVGADADGARDGRADGDGDQEDGDGQNVADASATGPDDEEDDEVPCAHPDCDETFGSEHGMRIHHSKTHRGEGTAPHRDPEQLREVYEGHDTFADMRDALGVSVASNTVRRQLIEHGIHDPTGSDADEDGPETDDSSDGKPGVEPEDGETGRAVSDGGRAGRAIATGADEAGPAPEPTGPAVEGDDAGPGAGDDEAGPKAGGDEAGLEVGDDEQGPEIRDDDHWADAGDDERKGGSEGGHDLDCEISNGVTATELRDVLADATTVYDVQSALDLERDATMDLLSEVGLLSVVHGRVATKRDRDEQRAEIDERIRNYVEQRSD